MIGNVKKYNGQSSTPPVQSHIYGAEWAGTSDPSWVRTDDAANFADPNPYYAGMTDTPGSPFDNLMPWSGMKRVTDDNAGEVVEIPKFWYKWTRSGSSMKLQISDAYQEDFYTSPAHMDRGDGKGERDYVYVGRYHCSGASSGTYKSTSGVTPKYNMTRANFRTNIHKLGSTIWQWDYATLVTIWLLYLVEFAHWDSQRKIGWGCGNNSSVENTGASDVMPYHTGTIKSSRNTSGVGTQYRYIEGLWDNVFDYIDGIRFSQSSIYAWLNPSSASDSSGGTSVGTRSTITSIHPTTFSFSSASGYEWFMYPSGNYQASSDTYTAYICDRCSYEYRGVVLYVGGSYANVNAINGLFSVGGTLSASTSISNGGSRLMILP